MTMPHFEIQGFQWQNAIFKVAISQTVRVLSWMMIPILLRNLWSKFTLLSARAFQCVQQNGCQIWKGQAKKYEV